MKTYNSNPELYEIPSRNNRKSPFANIIKITTKENGNQISKNKTNQKTVKQKSQKEIVQITTTIINKTDKQNTNPTTPPTKNYTMYYTIADIKTRENIKGPKGFRPIS